MNERSVDHTQPIGYTSDIQSFYWRSLVANTSTGGDSAQMSVLIVTKCCPAKPCQYFHYAPLVSGYVTHTKAQGLN